MKERDRFDSFVQAERRRHTMRLCLACFLAALIGVVIYQTQWFSLRYGLMVLLVGQVGDVVALVSHLSKHLNETAFSSWFEREEQFIRHLTLFDAVFQMIGFLALGYAFWIYTGSLVLSLAIGILYPVTTYFGINRRRSATAIRRLRVEKQSFLRAPTEPRPMRERMESKNR